MAILPYQILKAFRGAISKYYEAADHNPHEGSATDLIDRVNVLGPPMTGDGFVFA